MPCISLPSGKMQGVLSAQTIPAHHGRLMEGIMSKTKFRFIYAEFLFACFRYAVAAYTVTHGHPYIGVVFAIFAMVRVDIN